MNEPSFIKSECRTPRLVVAGERGGAGKTIFTLGLIRHMAAAGKRVAVFKKGPDYIDARWLGAAGGGECTNLDPYLMAPETIAALFVHGARGRDVAIIEGNRGLYDGVDKEGSCSTAELAKLLQAPVILVVNCTKVTRSAAALVLGFRLLDQGVRLAGVVLNQVAGPRHRRILTQSIEEYGGIPVLGAIPRLKEDPLPMRHLGLTPLEEHGAMEEPLQTVAGLVEENCDLERILELLAQQPPVEAGAPPHLAPEGGGEVTIGVIRDAAFQFYYPENLEALESRGARLIFLDALRDGRLPDLDALYIGGGFPETSAGNLARNRGFMGELRSAAGQGLPIYAECGGVMYLGTTITWRGRRYPMAGVHGWGFVMESRPVGHGYCRTRVDGENPFYPVGTELVGHEFHYSRPVLEAPDRAGRFCCSVLRGHGFGQGREGLVLGSMFGTYNHLHAAATPGWADGLVAAARRFKGTRPRR